MCRRAWLLSSPFGPVESKLPAKEANELDTTGPRSTLGLKHRNEFLRDLSRAIVEDLLGQATAPGAASAGLAGLPGTV
jgi:hypothetical protein